MKTGLGLYQKYRMLYAYFNLLRFGIKKALLGFDVANIFIQRVDKYSLRLILKKNGAKIGRDCDIETGQIFHNCKNYSNLSIGNNCHIGKNCFFDLRDRITIGDNVVISMKCTFITHIDMSRSALSRLYPSVGKPVVIKSNAYVGANANLLMGSEIGENGFLTAGSLLNTNIEPYSMAGGIPAKLIRKFDFPKG
ncbi:MAG TPA: DapH/DapD/GlmU-related protein [Bacteroidales bacterium]|nr:DapH/DapD/GlmU-related protein [Bacteroidales bacterium]